MKTTFTRFACISIILLCFSTVKIYAQNYNIVPYPNQLIPQEGKFILKEKITISGPDSLTREYGFLQDILSKQGITSSVKKRGGKITFSSNSSLGTEAYTMEINKKGIHIEYGTSAGAFYAIQTLQQMIEPESKYGAVPCVQIADAPAFPWRAFMLDEGRYFKGKTEVKKLLDEMARLKMNVFHWHLTEEVGWRLEIKKYPLLTEVGAVRDSCRFGQLFDPLPHEGYYSQEDAKEIIRYAAARHIMVVPEIEMPGHASGAIAAYPWLGARKGGNILGTTSNVFNVADPKVIGFLHDVLDEVIELFPSPVIHIGGDEVDFKRWESVPEITEYMKKNRIQSYPDLQIWFTNEISNYLASKNRRMMGWNEITGDLHPRENANEEGKQLAKSSIVHFWEGDLGLIKKAIEKGYDVVNSDRHHTYLDYYYDYTPLEKAYKFNPIPDGLTPEQAKKIKGIGCQMWGEKIREVKTMNYYIYPRIAAYAECGWTRNENKDYERFLKAYAPIEVDWKAKGYWEHK